MARLAKYAYVGILLMFGLLAAGCAAAQSSVSPTSIPATDTRSQVAPSTAVAAAPTANSASQDTIRLVAVQGQSEARYRVREQLAQVPLPSDAIGKTKQITGTIVGKADGTILSAESKFVVDLNSLQSDRSQRDNFLRRNVLQTNQYPNAVFVPNRAEGLPLQIPPAGPVNFKLSGDLTVRNVTKPVTWDVKCEPQGEQGSCTATTSFTFGYMGLQQPQVPVVLSVQDNITLEVDMVLQRSGS